MPVADRAISNKASAPAAPASSSDEEAQLAAALKASTDEHLKSEAARQAKLLAAQHSASSATIGGSSKAAGDIDMEAALALSLAESALQDALARRDKADLEAAIALSLQLEQQRLDEALERALTQPDPPATAAVAASAAVASPNLPVQTLEPDVPSEIEAERMAKELVQQHAVEQARAARQVDEEKARQQAVL
jgi:hypothetical protein